MSIKNPTPVLYNFIHYVTIAVPIPVYFFPIVTEASVWGGAAAAWEVKAAAWDKSAINLATASV